MRTEDTMLKSTSADPKNPESYTNPLYTTPHGGLAHMTEHGHGPMVFQEVPDMPDFKVGDAVPHDWELIPANQAARDREAGMGGGDSLWT